MKPDHKISHSLISLVLLVFLTVPTVLKLAHASHHITVECDSSIESHFHEIEFSCDFDNFNFSHDFYTSEIVLNFVAVFYATRIITINYDYTPKLENLLFSLRAPPTYS